MSSHRPSSTLAALAACALLAACAGSAATPSQQTTASPVADAEAVFREFNAAVNSGDAAAAAALVAEDASFYGERAADLGVDGVVATLACATEIVSAQSQGDSVIVELEATGPAPLAAESGGCAEDSSRSHRITVREGKIVEITEVP